jgi:pilus assembly protein CpaF
MEGDTVTLQDLFTYDMTADTGPIPLATLRPTGIRPRFADSLAMYGVTLPASMFTGGKR